jgi:protein arginine N-methyltransferase 1
VTYLLADYDAMFADNVRTREYLAAIAATVKPDDVVVEIGTGVGYFAVAACRAGARRVYAIEINPQAAIARELFAANDCADRVTLVRGDSRQLSLPERGDVLLADLRGVTPFEGMHLPTIIDARERLLRPGARFVTIRDTIWAAPCVADAKFIASHVTPGDRPHGIVREPVARRVRQDWYRARLTSAELFAPPALVTTLDYTVLTGPDAHGTASWTIARDGVIDGIAVWFDTELGGGFGFSNAPSAPPAIYGQAFFSLEQPIDARAGDTLSFDLRAKLIEEQYVFAWDSTFVPQHGPRIAFRQSNLGAMTSRIEELRRRLVDFTPTVGTAQRQLSALLSLVDGARPIDEIARRLRAAHGVEFPEQSDALAYATTVLANLADDDAARVRKTI